MCIAAANYIINAANKYNEGKTELKDRIFMSSKRLQKILFFSDVLYMIENNGQSMFSDDYYAWPSGPVIPSVYNEFKEYQDGKMYPHYNWKDKEISDKIKDTIDRVLKDTNTIGTYELVEKSHIKGGPWDLVFKKRGINCGINDFSIIKKKKIYKYYKKINAPYGMQNG